MKWVSCFCFRPFWSIHPSIAPWSLRVNVLHIRSAQRQQGSVHHQGMKQDLRVRTLASNQMCQVKSPGTVNHGTIEIMVNHGRWRQSMVNHGKWWRKHQRSLNDCEVWFTMIYWWLTYPSGIIIPNIWMIYQPVYHDLPWFAMMIQDYLPRFSHDTSMIHQPVRAARWIPWWRAGCPVGWPLPCEKKKEKSGTWPSGKWKAIHLIHYLE